MTTKATRTVTTKQIEELRDEAGAAGDMEQVRICERALRGSRRARAECVRVIATVKTTAEAVAGLLGDDGQNYTAPL
jgi:hypothetical protein